jgi:RNA polymerase primary sigma factor
MAYQKFRKLSDETLKRYFTEISKIQQISPDEEKKLGRLIHQGDKAALNKLVEANLRFVVVFAKKYRNGPLGLADLIEEGNLGLIEAAKRFDPDKGVKFITYASWWIRQAIIHALGEQGRTIRLPQRRANLLYRLGRNYNELRGILQREPTPDELAKELEIPVEQADELMQYYQDDVSLDATLSDSSNLEIKDLVSEQNVEPVDLMLIRKSFESQIRDLVGELNPKEKVVISERFGLEDDEPKTLQQVGEKLGVTRERVRQIEQQAMNKMKRNVKVRRLRTYLN